MESNPIGKPGDGLPGSDRIAELVRQAQGGDRPAFDELVRLFQRSVYNVAYRMVNAEADADDLAQEVFVKLYRSIGKFRGDAKFSTWLYALTVNTCRSGLRRLRRWAERESIRLDADTGPDGHGTTADVPDPGAGPDRLLEQGERRQQIGAVVAALPGEFRTVLVLRDIEGLSYEEIAVVLGCSIGTVKSRLARARNRAKERLCREGLLCAVSR